MQKILHVVTKADDSLSANIINCQREMEIGREVKVIDLTGPEPDYQVLLEEIFAADSVHVW